MNRLPKIAVLTGPKSAGSTMKALAKAGMSGSLQAQIALVIAPITTSPSLQTAQRLGIECIVFEPGTSNYAQSVLQFLKKEEIELICLAGFLRLVPGEIISQFPYRILNIHPALLPKFGGKGMYGAKVHQAVAEANQRGEESTSGCTIHYVNEHYDEGDILLQKQCSLPTNATPMQVEELVRALEPEAYIEAINLHFANQRNSKT